VAIQLHLVIKFEVPLLDGSLDPHSEDPAVVDGVRVPVVDGSLDPHSEDPHSEDSERFFG
jgi:hypothetical protein